MQPIHAISQMRNPETGAIVSVSDLMLIHATSDDGSPDFLGLKRSPDHDGYELYIIDPYSQIANCFCIPTDGSPAQIQSLDGAEIGFYKLDGRACMDDMDAKVAKLKEHTAGETILGAVMFTCNGRGPQNCRDGLIPERMSDATRFANGFPTVPCLGFYAGGEIGPLAKAGQMEEIFQTGSAALQGFTAVFALFVVPKVEEGRLRHCLDDSVESVLEFVDGRLS